MLLNNIIITGGGSSLKNIEKRIIWDLTMNLPQNTSIRVFKT